MQMFLKMIECMIYLKKRINKKKMGQSTSKHGEMHEFNPLDWDPET